MTTFSTQYFTCNHCKHAMFQYELASYHVYSSEVYSDGYVDYNPPVSFNPLIIICSKCRKPLWYEDLNYTESLSDAEKENADKSCDVYDLPISRELNFNYKLAEYYTELIGDGFVTSNDKEIKLRIEIWHLLNNDKRFGTMSWFIQLIHGRFHIANTLLKGWKKKKLELIMANKLFRRNLNKLCAIYQSENDEDRLLLAEMFRESREFGKAKSILKELVDLVGTNAYKKILKATKYRKSRVIKLN
jgi:hypothetical protein